MDYEIYYITHDYNKLEHKRNYGSYNNINIHVHIFTSSSHLNSYIFVVTFNIWIKHHEKRLPILLLFLLCGTF